MPTFTYQGIDPEGEISVGQIDANSLDEARGRLLERGLNISNLTEVIGTATRVLSGAETDEVLGHISRLATSGFPLGAGLRAASAESSSKPVAQSLALLADKLDRGQALPEILQDSGSWLPTHVAGLIGAALRTGRLSEALVELVDQQRDTRALRQRIWQAMAYPIVVAILATVLLTLISFLLTGAFERLFREFNMTLPLATQHLLWWRETGIWFLLLGLGLLILAGAIYRQARGPAAWARLTASLPLFGQLFYLRSMAEWAGLMSVLVKNHVPLPDALRWSADGVSNAWVAHTSRQWAHEAAEGRAVSDMLAGPTRFSNSLAPLIRWGEKSGSLAEAFAASREVLERRVQLRAELLRTILPPLLFVAIACGVMVLLVALFMPIIVLLRGLSS